MANTRIHNYFERLRNLSESKKKRFVAIASSITMVIVVLLWVVYLNFTLPMLTSSTKVVKPEVINDTGGAVQTDSGNSFFSVISRGAKVIGGNISNQFISIKESAMREFSKIGGHVTKRNEA